MLTGLIISSQKSTISSPPLKVNQLEVFAVCISRGLNFQSYFLLRREWPSALTTRRVESWDTFILCIYVDAGIGQIGAKRQILKPKRIKDNHVSRSQF